MFHFDSLLEMVAWIFVGSVVISLIIAAVALILIALF